MALNLNNIPSTSKKYELLPAGVYPVRLVQVIDLGLQKRTSKDYGEKAPAYQINVSYEFLDEFLKDEEGNELLDKPRWLSERINMFPLSSDLATSTKRYRALDPEETFEGDFAQLLGLPCNASVIIRKGQKGERNGIANIAAMRPKDAANAPKLVGSPVLFTLDDPDMEVFNSLPDWLQEVITNNLEFAGSPLEAALGGSKPAPKKKQETPAEDSDDDGAEDAPY